jgi:hypothetical protein
MEIYSYHIDGNYLTLDGVCDKWFEILWTRRFFKGDDFTITLPPTSKNIELFSEGKVIELAKVNPLTGASEHAGIITSTEITSGEKAVLTVSGQNFVGLLSRRILADYALGDTTMTVLRKNAGDLAQENRQLGATIFDSTVDCPAYQAGQMLFKRLSDFVGNIASVKGWSLQSRIAHDKSGVQIVMSGRQSVDRSVLQANVARVIFSDVSETATDFERQHSDNGAVTGVVVGSLKQYNSSSHIDVEQYIGFFGDARSYDRIESYKSITPVTKIEIRQKDVEWTVLDEWETFRVADEMAAASYVLATDFFGASIVINGDWESKFAVGDVVTVQNTAWNAVANKQVTEVREYWGADNITVTATLGEPQKTLAEILKKG